MPGAFAAEQVSFICTSCMPRSILYIMLKDTERSVQVNCVCEYFTPGNGTTDLFIVFIVSSLYVLHLLNTRSTQSLYCRASF